MTPFSFGRLAIGGKKPEKSQITLTTASSVELRPLGSVTRTLIVQLLGAVSVAAENVALWPSVSNVPSLSRSHS